MKLSKHLRSAFTVMLMLVGVTFGQTAGATTKTYTVTGGNGGSPTEFYALFSDGSSSSGQVNWTYNSTAEISFSLPGGPTLKLSDTAKQLVYSNGAIGGRGATTFTVSSSTYYIYRVRLLDSNGNVIQLDANGNAVTHDGVSECDYWNMTKSFSHTFSNGILFSKIEVSYATAIPITDAVITGLNSQYPVSNAAVTPTPTVTWHGTTLTKGTHYSLTYQNNTAAGTATVYATGKGIFSTSTSVSADYTLVWATYSVRFNKNNDAATGTMSNQAFTYSTAQALAANAFTRTGYTFAGWNTAANGSGTSYTDEQEVQNLTATNGGTVDLYAQWTQVWKGSGTQEDPYVITTTAGLDLLAKYVNGTDGYTPNDFSNTYFKLGDDISYTHITDWNDAASMEDNYTAIGGRINDSNRYFRGTFDGQGHTVSGIRIYKGGTTDADSYQGLFGWTSGATIRNVILADARITGKQYVGGIAGYNEINGSNGGIVENCRVGSDVTIHAVADNAYYHGGVVGDCNGGTISGCVSAATLTVADGLTVIYRYGGIVGDLNGDMSDCLAIGASVPAVEYNGAIAGGVDISSTQTNTCYHGCTVGNAASQSDAYTVSAGTGVTLTHAGSPDQAYPHGGIQRYGGILCYGGVLYAPAGADVSLSITVPTGFILEGYTASAGTISGNVLTMPAQDVTINATLTDVWNITAGNDGSSAEKAYVITTTAGLDLLAKNVNGTDGYTANDFSDTYFKLGDDISYTHITDWNDAASMENNYTAIGGNIDGNWRYFCGTFDGQGHTVSGIRIYKGGTTGADSYQGLFGRTSGATIRNVILADARITGKQYVGGIAGYIQKNNDNVGIVENCRVGSDVAIHAVANNAYYHGGVVGRCNGGTISGCVSAATLTVADGLTGIYCYGGIVGELVGDMSDCLAIGASVPAVNNNGAIAGDVRISYSTQTNTCYHGCTVGNAAPQSDAYTVSAGTGVTLTHAGSPDQTYPHGGIQRYGSILCYGGVLYAPAGADVSLSLSIAVPTGFILEGYTASAGTISGNVLTMPAQDVTINATLTDVWNITAGNDGSSAEKAYVITTTAGLDLLAKYVNGTDGYTANDFSDTYFKLGDDISYTHTTDWNNAASTENNYTAIGGRINDSNRYFRGTFDGQGHTVSGIRIYKGGTTDADSYQGLFGWTSGATIRNVILADAHITGYHHVGGIAGYLENGRIDSCGNFGTVYAGGSFAGGIVGECKDYGYITNSFNTGYVKAEVDCVGGIAGRMSSSTDAAACYVQKSFNSGYVKGRNHVGGIVGRMSNQNYFSTCYNTGVVKGVAQVGGLVGLQENPTETSGNSYSAGWVESSSMAGAVCGFSSDPTKLVNCHYDNLMCSYKGVNEQDVTGVTGHPTAGMVGTGLGFTDGWVTDDAMYPRLSAFATSTAGIASALKVDFGTDFHGDYKKAYDLPSGGGADYLLPSNGELSWKKFEGTTVDMLVNNTNTLHTNGARTMEVIRATKNDTAYRYLKFSFGISERNPIMITTPDQLSELRNIINNPSNEPFHGIQIPDGGDGYYFSLQNDVSFTDMWTPIGTSEHPFKGYLDGRNRDLGKNSTITILNVNTSSDYVGLFGYMQGRVKNVTVTGDDPSHNFIKGRDYVGAIAGYCHGTIDSCAALAACDGFGKIEGRNYVGGLVGQAFYSQILNCSNGCNVKGDSYVGGIVGDCSASVVSGCVNTIPGVSTSYVDACGVEHTTFAIPLDNTMTTLAEGTYVVNSDVAYTSTVTTTGDVTLILGDGCTMSFGSENEPLDKTIMDCQNYNLTIYGQAQGTGRLEAYSGGIDYSIYADSYTQHSGNVFIRSYGNFCIRSYIFILRGGTLYAESDYSDGDISAYNISIQGGQLQAVHSGLYYDNNITLGWTNPTDFIYANYIEGGNNHYPKIADGQTLVDEDGNIYSGTLGSYITEHTLQPVSGVTLTKDGSGNVSAAFDGTSLTTVSIPVNVTVKSVTYDRTFTKGKPATVMLPFSMYVNAISGGTFYTFGGVEKENDRWVATMNAVTGSIEANTPYLVMPTETSLTFNNGTYLCTEGGGGGQTADEGSNWTFKGTYDYIKWTTDTSDPDYTAGRAAEIGRVYGFAGVAKSENSIEVGDFVKVASGARIRPMSAYLMWSYTPNQAPARTGMKAAADTADELPQSITVRLLDASGTVTNVGEIDTETGEISFEGWYTLQGVKLDAEPTEPGIYIYNGKTVSIQK